MSDYHQHTKPAGRVFIRLGAVEPYQVRRYWKFRFRWWHPLTWLVFTGAVAWYWCVGAVKVVVEVWREMFPPVKERGGR